MTDINWYLYFSLIILLLTSCTGQKEKETKTHIVKIQQMSFVPEQLTVSPGDSVKWINKDLVSHDVKSTDSEDWKSSILEEGESFTIEITDETKYKCSLHPVMEGEIQLRSQP
jgi:plastocyanin